MAKKKPTHQHIVRPKEFHVAPFGALKGLAVSGLPPEKVLLPIVKKTPPPDDSGSEIFLQAVADVQPIESTEGNQTRPLLKPVQNNNRETGAGLIVHDESAFIEEIGRLKLDTKFSDSVPDDGDLQPLTGNRLKQVRRGIISVSHQLDLHGLTREEALAALPLFLLSAQKKGQKAVLVITGKGNHSTEEPILQQAVASWLRDAGRTIVVEFASAPRDMGGSGAYVVFLRPLTPPA